MALQDYISVPQSNQNCFYLSNSPLANSFYTACASHSFDYGIDEQNMHIGHPYNSFASSSSTAAVAASETYRNRNPKVNLLFLPQFMSLNGRLIQS